MSFSAPLVATDEERLLSLRVVGVCRSEEEEEAAHRRRRAYSLGAQGSARPWARCEASPVQQRHTTLSRSSGMAVMNF